MRAPKGPKPRSPEEARNIGGAPPVNDRVPRDRRLCPRQKPGSTNHLMVTDDAFLNMAVAEQYFSSDSDTSQFDQRSTFSFSSSRAVYTSFTSVKTSG